jgi:large subunit ribosomal protein L2
MGLRKLKPVTPGTRHAVVPDYAEITKSTPEKSLLAPNRKSGGRNGSGKMTMRNIGGGHKQKYRIIDFKRDKDGVPAKVEAIEYDPNRTSRIALLFYADGEKRYILAPEGLEVGATILSGSAAEPVVGNAKTLAEIPPGTFVHCVEIQPGKGGAFARSAGSNVQLLGREGKMAILKMPSGETRMVLALCKATIGKVGNAQKMNTLMGKAGRNRWLGRRPRVRAVAMNPVDHPMGGGEGRASGGHPRSRKGIPAKGYKTRSPKKITSKFIVSKRKSRSK